MTLPTNLPELLESSKSLSTPSKARLQALYTFTSTQELTNPAGYENNLKWWSTVIEESLREGILGRASGSEQSVISTKNDENVSNEEAVVFTGDRLGFEVDREALGKALEWTTGDLTGTGRSKGLACVINSHLSSQPPRYLPLTTFLASPTPIHQPPSLTSRYVAAPLWWGLSKLNPFGSSAPTALDEDKVWKRFKGVKVIHLGLIEESAQYFISHLTANPPLSHSTSLLTPHSFQSQYSHLLLPSKTKGKERVGLSLGDCKALLRYLQRDKGVLVADEKGEVHKIVPPEMTAADCIVTEADRGTVAIMATLDKLDRQISGIHQEMIIAQTKAGTFLKQNQKSIALSYLRSKKQLESVLEKRIGAAEQLRTVLRGIDNAQGDVEIIKAYETSTATLRSVLADPALQRDRVDATMDALSDALADQEEIDQAIQSGGLSAVAGTSMGGDVDEDELEKELQGLVEDKQKDDETESLAEKERQRMEKESQDEAEKKQKDAEVEERLAKLRPAASNIATKEAETMRDVAQIDKSGVEAA